MADEVASARRALGRQLAASRHAAGLSQQKLAALLGYSRSTVANVETGHQHVPRDFFERSDAALSTGTALTRGHDDVEAIARQRDVRTAAQAQQARAALSVAGSGRWPDAPRDDPRPTVSADGRDAAGIESLRVRLNSVLSSGAVSGASLDAWEEAVLHHGRMTRYRPSRELLAELSADLAELEPAMTGCRAPGALRRLTRVAAQMSGLMCLLFVKLDEREAFRRWARTAQIAASEVGDSVTLSWVCAQEAYGLFYMGEMRGALSVAQRAQGLMRRSACVGGVLAAAVEARAHAARGDVRGTRDALGRAENILDALDPGLVTASASGYSESQLRFHQGSAYTRLGDTRSAFVAHERALEVCPPEDYTDWALTRLDRARCFVHDGDPGAAAAYAAETMTQLNSGQRQGIIAMRGRELVGALPRAYQNVAAARELAELLSTEAVEELS